MSKKEGRIKIYPEYAKKYEGYNINISQLQHIEKVCEKTYEPDMGINLECYIRMNLRFEVLS